MKALVFALALTFGFSTTALAEEPEAERFGEVHITLKNAEYCKVEVNGVEYGATEFERGGKLLLIKGLPLADAPFEITMIPFNPKLADGTLTFADETFKKKRKGRVYYFIATGSVKFDARPETDEGDEKPGDDKPDEAPAEPVGPPDEVPEL